MADHSRCWVPREEKGGMLCVELGTVDDLQRGRKVCAKHRPHPVRKKLLKGTLSMELQTTHPSLAENASMIGGGAEELCPVCNQLMVTDQATTTHYDLTPVARARTVSFHTNCATIFERERAVMRARCDLPGS